MKDYSATTGTAIADEGAWNTAGTFQHIALDRITPSLTNPRKTFDPAKLAELAASIRASGVHQAVLVRPLPGSRMADTDRTVQYELVVGERRLRASSLAGMDTIPAMVRPSPMIRCLKPRLCSAWWRTKGKTMTAEVETLADALPKEMARVREILGYYKEIGPAGMFGAAMIEQDLRAADAAVMSGDVVAMIQALQTLRGITG